jgi:predicted RNase H-like HicB family nuclease
LIEYRYTVLFEPAEDGKYVVTCAALPGLVTEGDTLEEARAMAADAIRGYSKASLRMACPYHPKTRSLPQSPSVRFFPARPAAQLPETSLPSEPIAS